jgi:hypothetical protein
MNRRFLVVVGGIIFVWTVLTAALISSVVIQSVEQRIYEATRRPDSVFCLLMTDPGSRTPDYVEDCWDNPPDTIEGFLQLIPADRR